MDLEKTPGGDSIRAAELQLPASGNGRTLTGLAVPYGVLTEIKDQRGHYQEMIAPGAFTAALAATRPRMFFEHGQDTRTGKTPIGSFDRVWEESDGVHVSGELFDNELVRPLADAARAGELPGWSIHFRTSADGKDEHWARTKGWDIRTVNRAQLPEISLVNFGAYPTTVSVRSGIDQLTGRSDVESGPGGSSDEKPGNGDSPKQPSTQSIQQLRDRTLRLRGIIRGK
jgi:HK97 family phage prohead protease